MIKINSKKWNVWTIINARNVNKYFHALWQCTKIQPFWEPVLRHLDEGLGFNIPLSPRICLLGDKTEVPYFKNDVFSLIIVNITTAAHIILRFWKGIQFPTLKLWI